MLSVAAFHFHEVDPSGDVDGSEIADADLMNPESDQWKRDSVVVLLTGDRAI